MRTNPRYTSLLRKREQRRADKALNKELSKYEPTDAEIQMDFLMATQGIANPEKNRSAKVEPNDYEQKKERWFKVRESWSQEDIDKDNEFIERSERGAFDYNSPNYEGDFKQIDTSVFDYPEEDLADMQYGILNT